MGRRTLISALLGVLGLSAAWQGALAVSAQQVPQSATQQPQVKMRAALGQRVMIEGRTQKAYLRIDLEALPLPNPEVRTSVNVAIVLDKSGSMKGRKLEQAKEAAVMALNRLGDEDVVSVVAYNHAVQVVVPATRARHRAEMRDKIRRFRADGRTALYAGVDQGIREVGRYFDRNRVNRVILLSDGLANVGPSSPEELGRLGQAAAQRGISVTTIGLGLGYNEDLMSKLAFASDGNHAFVEKADDLVGIFNKEFGDVLSVAAQDVEVIIHCRAGVRPIRVMGRTAHISGQSVRLRLNQLYGAQEKYVILEFEVDKDLAENLAEIADVRVTYTNMANKVAETLEDKVQMRFTRNDAEARDSVDKRVMGGVVNQIATEQSEKAVKLRDSGNVSLARKVLEENAAYLRDQAQKLGSQELETMAQENKQDADSLTSGLWSKSRKSMRARQHKYKTQQSY